MGVVPPSPFAVRLPACPAGRCGSIGAMTESAPLRRAPGTHCALVAVKPLESAKSRLSSLPTGVRRALAGAFLADSLAAWQGSLGTVFVVGPIEQLRAQTANLPTPVELVRDPQTGLNDAFLAAAKAAGHAGFTSVVASVADLPALTSAVCDQVVSAAGRHRRSYLPDHTGMGTTMLFGSVAELDPRFENGSAGRHRLSGAADLTAPDVGPEAATSWPGARHDVDEPEDLRQVLRLGVGPQTARVIAASGLD